MALAWSTLSPPLNLLNFYLSFKTQIRHHLLQGVLSDTLHLHTGVHISYRLKKIFKRWSSSSSQTEYKGGRGGDGHILIKTVVHDCKQRWVSVLPPFQNHGPLGRASGSVNHTCWTYPSYTQTFTMPQAKEVFFLNIGLWIPFFLRVGWSTG